MDYLHASATCAARKEQLSVTRLCDSSTLRLRGDPGSVLTHQSRVPAPGTLLAKWTGKRGSKKGHSKSEVCSHGEAKANGKDENQFVQS